jgi:hypothetical protein
VHTSSPSSSPLFPRLPIPRPLPFTPSSLSLAQAQRLAEVRSSYYCTRGPFFPRGEAHLLFSRTVLLARFIASCPLRISGRKRREGSHPPRPFFFAGSSPLAGHTPHRLPGVLARTGVFFRSVQGGASGGWVRTVPLARRFLFGGRGAPTRLFWLSSVSSSRDFGLGSEHWPAFFRSCSPPAVGFFSPGFSVERDLDAPEAFGPAALFFSRKASLFGQRLLSAPWGHVCS